MSQRMEEDIWSSQLTLRKSTHMYVPIRSSCVCVAFYNLQSSHKRFSHSIVTVLQRKGTIFPFYQWEKPYIWAFCQKYAYLVLIVTIQLLSRGDCQKLHLAFYMCSLLSLPYYPYEISYYHLYYKEH